MAGALIFVAYESADGNSVTISPRLGAGHVMPIYTSSVTITMLPGTGVYNGEMVANFMCSNCRSWSGGSIDITSTSQNMIYAMGPQQQIQSNDPSFVIQQHSNNGGFNMNLKAATGTAGVPSTNAASSSSTSRNSGGLFGSGYNGPSLLIIHAGLMTAAFLFLFPAGYLALRLFEKVWLHYGIQTLALLIAIGGLVIGVALSKSKSIVSSSKKPPNSIPFKTNPYQQSPNLTHPHQLIGFVVVGLAFSAWIVGLTGHIIFRRTGSPAKIMRAHRILGPSTLLLGLVNGVIGLNWVDNTRGMWGWIIVSGLLLIAIVMTGFFHNRRKMRKQAMHTPAAQNFRTGTPQQAYGPVPQNAPYDQAIPLQSYRDDRNQPYDSAYAQNNYADGREPPRYG